MSNGAIASVLVGFAHTPTALRATITGSGTGRYVTSGTRGYSRTGPHSTLLTLRSSKPMKATLRASYSLTFTGTRGATAGAFVDIGNNGSVEFTSAMQTEDFPVTIDSTGLAIATTSRGSADANSTSRFVSYVSTLTIEILPPPTGLFFSHGAPCGPTLSARSGFSDAMTIEATGAASNASGMLVLGVQRTSLTLPGTTCLLRVQPLLTIPIRFTAAGTFSMTGTVPTIRPFVLPMQIGAFGTALGTSNALTIICP